MKLNKLLVIFIFFLAVGAVSASDNATDAQIADDINVTFEDKIYQEDLGDIEVDLPENASGRIRASVDDVEIYNENITDKHIKIPIVIPKPTGPVIVPNRPIDHTSHNLVLFYNDITVKSASFKVMKFNQSHDYGYGIPSEILKGDNSYQHFLLIFPSSANGTVEIYVDGILKEKLNTTTYLFINNSNFNSLELGNHTVRIVYSGDDYYLPSDKTYNFTVVDMLIHIPTSIVLDHDDCLTAKLNENRDGVISVFIDSRQVKTSKLDKNGEFLYSLFDDITCGIHEIEVRYVAKNFTRSKKATVNVSYVVDAWEFGSAYGDDNSVIVTVPYDFNPKLLTLSIDGVKYAFEIDNSGWIELNTSKLGAGNHTLTFDFAGDEKYYPQSFDYNFTVDYYIKITDWVQYFGDSSEVSLTLPVNANGTLDVFINGSLFESVKMLKGEAKIMVSGLECGNYVVSAVYSGSDFNVSEAKTWLGVIPKIISPYEISEGENRYVTVYVSKTFNGMMILKLNDEDYEVNVVNGKATFSLKGLKVGEYDIEAVYCDDNGKNHSAYSYLTVEEPPIKISSAKNIKVVYTSNAKYSVKVTKGSKILKNVWVTFKFAKKTIKAKTNSKGIATVKVPKLAPGKYSIKVSYKGVKVSKILTVKHLLTLKTVKVKKSAKKLVLSVKTKKALKGKIVKFKFAKKTYKAKVNKKGIAKVTVKKSVLKKLKVGKTVKYQASYLKDTVSKSAKVKK